MLFEFLYPNVWDALKESSLPIVLYGMGNGADKVLDEFEKRKIRAAGVMASEGFVRHQSFRSFTVKSEKELTDELEDFLVVLCFGSNLSDVMDAVRRVGERHPLLVPNVPVCGSEILDDAYLSEHREEIAKAYGLLTDVQSKKVFKGALDFLYTGRLSYLSLIESEKAEVFENILKLKNERYLDLGAYRGDTVEEFLTYTDGYEHITALEPNPKNFEKLKEYAGRVERVTVINGGVSDSDGVMYVSKNSGRMAALSEETGTEVKVFSVDSLSCSPTYIKADVEGCERRMIDGMARTLKTKPKLNIAAYHRTGDFFSLLLLIHKIQPSYRFYLRKHPYIPCWDLNLYAV